MSSVWTWALAIHTTLVTLADAGVQSNQMAAIAASHAIDVSRITYHVSRTRTTIHLERAAQSLRNCRSIHHGKNAGMSLLTRPVNCAGRFSKNAVMPSLASADFPRLAIAMVSISWASIGCGALSIRHII